MPFNKSAAPLLALPRPVKRLVVVALDLVLLLISIWAAFYLRLDQTGLPLLVETQQAATHNDEVVIKNILMKLVHGYSPGPAGASEASVQV